MLDKNKNRGSLQLYLRNLNVRWFEFDLTDLLEMRFEESERERYSAIRGDLLVCEGGYPGRAAIWDGEEPIFFQKAVHRVRCHEPARAKWCLYYLYLSDIDGSLRNHFTGAGIQHLTGQSLKRLRLPLPPLPEQKRIVAILDEAFAGIATAVANAEKNRANARALFESHLEAVFTRALADTKPIPLAVLCHASRGITYGVIKLGADIPNGVPCLRTSNVRRLHIETDGLKRIDPEASKAYSRTILRGHEILVNVRGTLGGIAVVPTGMKGWNVSREVAVVPVDSNRINPEFVAYWIASRTSQKWLQAVQKGVAYTGINLEDLRTLPVPQIDKSRQASIRLTLDRVFEDTRHLTAIYQQKLSALAELKQALLRKAFAGELTDKAVAEAAA
jgi:type I restriction enzyme S subunit